MGLVVLSSLIVLVLAVAGSFDDLALEAWLRRLTVEGAEDTSSSSSSSTTSSSGLLNVNKMVVHETVVTAGRSS